MMWNQGNTQKRYHRRISKDRSSRRRSNLKEASKSDSTTLPLDYTTPKKETETDLDSTARCEAKPKELENTCEIMALTRRSGASGDDVNPNIEAIITQQLQNIIPQIVTHDGKGGVIVLTQWIKMEYVMDISGCVNNQKVKYAASLLINKALTWWNTQIQARGHEVALGMTWEKFKALLVEEFCLSNEMENEKRKEVAKSSKQGGSWTDNKRAKLGKHFVEAVPTRNEYAVIHPRCAKCNAHHPNARNNGNQVRGKAFNVNAIEAHQDPNVVTGTFSLNDHFATVLFDSGADFSFISTDFVPLLNVKPSVLRSSYVIEITNGRKVESNKIIRGCKLELGDSLFNIDLIPFGHKSFNVIEGMDWLSRHKAMIVFHKKVVRIPLENGKVLVVHEERTKESPKSMKGTKSDEPKLGDILII
ncbi:putative reverse transcriptase domain-containing protein [Tanacetum coccineum]